MKLGNRYSQHSFSQVPTANIQRSRFDRSFAVKDTVNFDYLTPIFIDEIIPGDTINLNFKTFIRLATQAVPVLDNMYVDFFFFFVPNRLVWENWEKFMGAQANPGDSTSYVIPKISSPAGTGFVVGSIYDHLGIPTGVPGLPVNALPLRAINLIWNEWFRDQNLQNSLTVPTNDGPDLYSIYDLWKRAKKHDYFTSALPWPQKGSAVSLPLAGSAPIKGIALATGTNYAGGGASYYESPGVAATGSNWSVSPNPNFLVQGTGTNQPNIRADLTTATAVTINQLRQAFMMQSLLEADARGGTRYTEIIKAHFNVTNPDFRLQRPEFLSGATIPINQHPVAQTSETGDTPQANLAAFSTAAEFGNKIGFSKSFTEHGYVIGLMQPRADVTYQQGLNRLWSRTTKYDFFWPKFQELGEQTILNKEIYAVGTGGSTDDLVFGYQERYAEYRYRPSEIKGQFRSTYVQSLDVWHLGQVFSALPTLSSTFIQSSTPIERVLVVTDPDYPDLLMDGFFDYKHARPMVTYGVPATLGRF